MDLKNIHKNAKEIKNILCLPTYPLAIKMLSSKEDIPNEAKRPLKDMGFHLDLCQGFAISRWGKKTIAMLKEDMWCMAPTVGFGFVEPSPEWLEGNHHLSYAMNQKVARNIIQSTPRFKFGEYIGIVFTPLEKCSFIPDLFITYCDPYQLTHILAARNCIDGENVISTLSGNCACVFAVTPVLQNKKCAVISPCKGAREIAMTQNHEIIFSAPIEILEDFINAFHYLEEHGEGLPLSFKLCPERKLKDGYADIGRTMGIKYEGVSN